MLKKIAVLVVVLVVLSQIMTAPRNFTRVRASNGRYYDVILGEGSQAAADRLGALDDAIHRFLGKAEAMAPEDPRLTKLRAKWKTRNQGNLTEIRYGHGDVAYSLDKDEVFVCVRNAGGQLETWNDCMYVLLHELSHVCTSEWGHTPQFWANFRWLLELAAEAGVYNYSEHADKTYCGHPLGENVLKCVRDRSCPSQLKQK